MSGKWTDFSPRTQEAPTARLHLRLSALVASYGCRCSPHLLAPLENFSSIFLDTATFQHHHFLHALSTVEAMDWLFVDLHLNTLFFKLHSRSIDLALVKP